MTENQNQPTETFRHQGRTVSVTMTNPDVQSAGNVHLGRRWVGGTPPRGITEPTLGFAIYCPASFIVEGLDYAIEFDIGSTSERAADVVITSLRTSSTGGVTRDGLSSVPTQYLLRAAMNAAAFTLLHYPTNYDGPGYALDDAGHLIEISTMTVRTDDEPAPMPIRHGGVPMPHDFAKAVSGLPELVGDMRLREVARIVLESSEKGIKWERNISKRFQITERHARRLVQEARDAGHLDPLPDTDKRTRRSKP